MLATALFAATAAGCGSDSAPCGGDFCEPTLTLKWSFNEDAMPGFPGDNCTDLGVRTVEVDLSGAGGEFSASEQCSFRQVVFTGIPASQYDIRLRPLDEEGHLVTTADVEAEVMFDGGLHEETVVNVGPDEWAGAHSGTFYFRLKWDGLDCADAHPPVVEHLLTLQMDGEDEPLELDTTAGDPVNGSKSGACKSFKEMFPQSVLDVPSGFATFSITGIDAAGDTAFEETFDTFIGAGLSNPEDVFDVAPTGAGS